MELITTSDEAVAIQFGIRNPDSIPRWIFEAGFEALVVFPKHCLENDVFHGYEFRHFGERSAFAGME
jgi:hypothetical protein